MGLELLEIDRKTKEAIQAFWGNRLAARKKQIESGKVDQGERGSVTGGNNMDGFLALIQDVIKDNGLPNANFYVNKGLLTLPGFFRPTKLWDLLVTVDGELIVAIELKSHVGPSFGNNFNNRTEEALGMGVDLWTAYREGAFGKKPRPFVGWLMLVEDAEGSRRPVKDKSPHFPVFPEFKTASYLKRYDIFCQKLIHEGLYTATALVASPREGETTGEHSEFSEMTKLKTFLGSLAGHVAGEALRLNGS